jgi:hypothetical protein
VFSFQPIISIQRIFPCSFKSQILTPTGYGRLPRRKRKRKRQRQPRKWKRLHSRRRLLLT